MSRRIRRLPSHFGASAAVPGLPKEIRDVITESDIDGEHGTHFSKTVKNILARTLEKSRQKLRYIEVEHDISKLSMNLNLGQYEFEDEKSEVTDVAGQTTDLALDVTALDRYNEDIRHHRGLLVEECRRLPENGEPNAVHLRKLANAIINLCRGSYYGTKKAQVLAGGAIPILVWLLNKPRLTRRLHLIIIRSLGELLYSSAELKFEFAQSAGVKILCKFLRYMPSYPVHSTMAAYVLAMAAVGSAEMIEEVRKQRDIEELIGEITFEYYWQDWPVNYGVILQGLIFGPHSVSANQELFQFL